MKRLNGLLLVVFFAVAAGGAVEEKMKRVDEKQAYEKLSPDERGKQFHTKRLNHLTQKLNLIVAEQVEKISKILKDGWTEIKAEREKMRAKVTAMRGAIDKKIEELLTPEQRERKTSK